ncbi:hypothetical protein BOX24_03010 [Leptospirillum ferriphilum]|uniref:Uncharacterized protein n=3 Tax=Leptospirillum ferriphilum TaxID=178606 RepID=A0A059Y307_9BACT|nr:hypothetical protein Y981_11275 [Leptospirillum ferriphilum YSK]OOH73978.1 hypothetical protein BOX24_03010 [Leptospirillum ferriphilum]
MNQKISVSVDQIGPGLVRFFSIGVALEELMEDNKKPKLGQITILPSWAIFKDLVRQLSHYLPDCLLFSFFCLPEESRS